MVATRVRFLPSSNSTVSGTPARSSPLQGVFLGSRPGRVQDRRVRRATAAIYAFDLLELDGQDLRREPLETRKATLASLLRGSLPGLRLNEHLAHDGELVFRHACKMGLEGIVSKRLGSRYRSGRSKDWLKFKNPDAPAVKREAEEDWGKERWR